MFPWTILKDIKKPSLWQAFPFSLFFWQANSSFCFYRLAHKTYKNVGPSYFSFTLILTPKFTTIEQAEYFKVFTLFMLILIISLLLFGIAFFLSLSTLKDSEKLSQYECGFEPFDEATRHPFDVHFYIVGILFLIFDVEIALLFPWVLALKFINWFGFFTMIVFLTILTVGFFYEWHRGALVWPQEKDSEKDVQKTIAPIVPMAPLEPNL